MRLPARPGVEPVSAPLFVTALGTSRLLASPGDRRLWLLDAPATALWYLYASGLDAATLAGLLTERFGLDPALALTQVEQLLGHWRQAGLLDNPAPRAPQAVDDPVSPAPCPTPLPAGAWRVRVADRAIGLGATDPGLRQRLHAWLPPPGPDDSAGLVDHCLSLHGDANAWRLTRDGQAVAAGQTRDEALLAVLHALAGLGCRPVERLAVLHGAGLVTPDGRGLLLIAAGGSGKSTLTTALDASGHGLLSDDVVPVDRDGGLLGLGLPLCLKAGSWPVLAAHRPDLDAAPDVVRYGQPVRFLAPRTHAPAHPVPAALILLIRYQPGQPPRATPVGPEQALQGLLGAEAVLRGLTQDKLDALARWVTATPGYTLTYPDLASGLAWVAKLLAQTGADRQVPPPCR